MFHNLVQLITCLSAAEIKCRDYTEKTKSLIQNTSNFPKPLPLIIGGQNVSEGEFPHMAVIGYQTNGTSELHWACGGSLISERFVLTAAHCESSPDYGKATIVRMGCTSMKASIHAQEQRIIKIIKHPRRSGYYYDIALFELEFAIKFNFYVRPACLNVHRNINVKTAVAIGFGVTEYTSSTLSEHLLKTTLHIYPRKNCTDIYAKIIKETLPHGIISSQLCAGHPEDSTDTCAGDSGGPLQIQLRESPFMYSIIGITSFGLFCGQPNMPSFSTKVSHFISWIDEIVWKE